jgi:molybdopterin molybdotransferase
MRDEHKFSSLEDARRTLISRVPVAGAEEVALAGALGRVLRQRVTCDIDYPRADVSAMDGYCLSSRDTAQASAEAPLTLPVRGRSTPGAAPPAVVRGSCALITTGAPIARGADAVVMYEDVVEEEGGESITLLRPVEPGAFVRRKGEVVSAGSVVLEPGIPITPAVLGILASFLGGPCKVTRRLRAGVLATGDELAPPGGTPGPYCIRDSNSPALAAMLESPGCEVVSAGRARDDVGAIVRGLRDLETCDVVVVSGGVSGGRFDLVPECLEEIGAEVLLRGVRMTPGKPFIFASRGDTVYFGVPGNPVSAVVALHMLIRPAVLAMMGRRDYEPVGLRAVCAGAFPRKRGYTTYSPGIMDTDLSVRPARFLGSSDIMSLAEANVLVCVPEEVEEIGAGETALVYPMGWFRQAGDALC